MKTYIISKKTEKKNYKWVFELEYEVFLAPKMTETT
jgi:hypothetical protein